VDRLTAVLDAVTVVPEAPRELVRWARDVGLPDQDAPVLAAGVQARADSLVTGDRTHFGFLFGCAARGVRIVALSDALRCLRQR
jgi:alpha-D-ribose 1-methylphosphonate 5-triphosphate diphosphatase PhnM